MSVYETTRAPQYYGHNFNSYPNNFSNSNYNLYPSLPSLPSLTTVPYSAVRGFDADVDVEQTAETLIPLDPNARPKHFRNSFEECIFVFTVMMAIASTTFLQGVVVINTATIGRSLHMTAAQITWIGAAIGLGSGSFMLFSGKTADLLGRKAQLLTGMAFLSLVSLITAFAPNGIALNILCGFLGLGTAAISPPAIGTLFATYPEGKRRNKATGALGSGNPVGFILGSISSGLATHFFNWRASFIVIAIWFLIITVLAFWTMPSIPRSGNIRTVAKQFDYLGTALIIVGIALFSTALTEGPEVGWKSPKVIITLILGLVCLFGFVFWERIYAHPLLNPVIWRDMNFTCCVLCVFFGYTSFTTNQFWNSLFMQDVQKLAPLHIAVRMLPQALAGITWSFVGQHLVSRINGTILMATGSIAYLTGATLLIFNREHTSYWKLLFPALIISVCGADFQFIVSNLYVTKQMPTQSSLGAGVLQTAMRLSVCIGLSMSTAVYSSASNTPKGKNDATFPFERAYLCLLIFAVIGLLFVPFMRLGTQGGKTAPLLEKESDGLEQERYRMGGEYADHVGGEHAIGSKTETSLNSSATKESEESYFPRWSWEGERELKADRYRDGNVIYEVCINCLAERRVVLDAALSNVYGFVQDGPGWL